MGLTALSRGDEQARREANGIVAGWLSSAVDLPAMRSELTRLSSDPSSEAAVKTGARLLNEALAAFGY